MSKTEKKSNAISSSELIELIRMQVFGLLENPKLAKELPPILIHGSPGIGKSTIVKTVAEDLGIGFIDVRLAEIDSVDIRGLPSVDNEKHSMTWNPPDFWPRDPNSKGILFLDEITSCSRDAQVAAYEIILDRKLGDFYHVPDGWYICAAGNLVEDNAVAYSMSSALANRFMHVELVEDADDWTRWAIQNSINPSVVGFIRYRPELLFNMENEDLERGWPSPRSWEKVSHMIDIMEKTNTSKKIVKKAIFGLVGAGTGAEFLEFYKNKTAYEDVLKVMTDPSLDVKIPDNVDQQYAIASAMVYHLWRGKDEKDEQNRIRGFFKLAMALPSNFSTVAVVDAMSVNSEHKKINKDYKNIIVNHPCYMEWAKKHGNAMKKHL